jgi:hypothetical protein
MRETVHVQVSRNPGDRVMRYRAEVRGPEDIYSGWVGLGITRRGATRDALKMYATAHDPAKKPQLVEEFDREVEL